MESDEKSWWPPQKAGSTPAEREEAPVMDCAGMGMAEGGIREIRSACFAATQLSTVLATS